MFTTATLLSSLRPVLEWGRVRRAVARPSLRPIHSVLAIEPCRVPAPVPIPMPRRPKALAAIAAAALVTVATVPSLSLADGYGRFGQSNFELTADGRLVDVQVQVSGVGTVPLYTASGRWDRRYFQALKGRNYSLVLRNNSDRRVGVLIAVDGLNVISGDRSSLSRNESMYVLDPFESTVIRGWRTSLDHVRRFVFVDEERSYAERTGQANGDMGWIRVLAFREQRPFWNQDGKIRTLDRDEEVPYGELEGKRKDAPQAKPEAEGLDRATPSPNRAYADDPNSNPGTGWGDSQRDPVNRTVFLAEATPVDQIVLRYEYASGLRALGIRIWNGQDRLMERERGQLGFAQAPRW